MPRKSPRRTSFSRVPEADRLRALAMIQAGEYRIGIVHACGISPTTVNNIARKAGLPLKIMKQGQRTPWRSLPPRTVEPVEGVNWRAVKASLRWGAKGFA